MSDLRLKILLNWLLHVAFYARQGQVRAREGGYNDEKLKECWEFSELVQNKSYKQGDFVNARRHWLKVYGKNKERD